MYIYYNITVHGVYYPEFAICLTAKHTIWLENLTGIKFDEIASK